MVVASVTLPETPKATRINPKVATTGSFLAAVNIPATVLKGVNKQLADAQSLLLPNVRFKGSRGVSPNQTTSCYLPLVNESIEFGVRDQGLPVAVSRVYENLKSAWTNSFLFLVHERIE